ncbi:MAG: PLP-dependent lyase/thiolase, partial [Bacteroidota bacterium]
MRIAHNPWRGGAKLATDAPYPSVAAARIAELLAACPAAQETPLQDGSSLAPLARLWIKDERGRMNLGSFKALGAAYVIACDAAAITSTPGADSLAGKVYVTA